MQKMVVYRVEVASDGEIKGLDIRDVEVEEWDKVSNSHYCPSEHTYFFPTPTLCVEGDTHFWEEIHGGRDVLFESALMRFVEDWVKESCL